MDEPDSKYPTSASPALFPQVGWGLQVHSHKHYWKTLGPLLLCSAAFRSKGQMKCENKCQFWGALDHWTHPETRTLALLLLPSLPSVCGLYSFTSAKMPESTLHPPSRESNTFSVTCSSAFLTQVPQVSLWNTWGPRLWVASTATVRGQVCTLSVGAQLPISACETVPTGQALLKNWCWHITAKNWPFENVFYDIKPSPSAPYMSLKIEQILFLLCFLPDFTTAIWAPAQNV